MDMKSKVLLFVTLLLLFLSVASVVYKTVILEDFEVVSTPEEEVDETIE